MDKYNIALDENESVADLPEKADFILWNRHPFAGMLPEGIVLYKREDKRGLLLQVVAPELNKYITFKPSSADLIGELFNQEIQPAALHLAMLLFDKQFPGRYAEFVKMRALAAALKLIPVVYGSEELE